jgi:hypothetical protein
VLCKLRQYAIIFMIGLILGFMIAYTTNTNYGYNETETPLSVIYMIGSTYKETSTDIHIFYKTGTDIKDTSTDIHVFYKTGADIRDTSTDINAYYQIGSTYKEILDGINVSGIFRVRIFYKEINDTLSYMHSIGTEILNATSYSKALSYIYSIETAIRNSMVFSECQGYSITIILYGWNNETLEKDTYNALCGVPVQHAPGKLFKIGTPGLYTPQALFSLLFYLIMIIIFNKETDFTTAIIISSGIMSAISIMFFPSLFWAYIVALAGAVAYKYIR